MKSKKTAETFTAKSADFLSSLVNLEDYDKASAQITVSNGSSFNGFTTLQVSNDYVAWTDVPSTTIAIAGTNDVQIYDLTETSTCYARIKITVSTGTADFTISWLLK